MKIKVFHISGPLLPLVLQLLQVEANIPNILVHTNSAEQRDDFLQTPNSQAKYTIKDGGSSRTFCPHVGGGHGWERGGGRLLVHRVERNLPAQELEGVVSVGEVLHCLEEKEKTKSWVNVRILQVSTIVRQKFYQEEHRFDAKK